MYYVSISYNLILQFNVETSVIMIVLCCYVYGEYKVINEQNEVMRGGLVTYIYEIHKNFILFESSITHVD